MLQAEASFLKAAEADSFTQSTRDSLLPVQRDCQSESNPNSIKPVWRWHRAEQAAQARFFAALQPSFSCSI